MWLLKEYGKAFPAIQNSHPLADVAAFISVAGALALVLIFLFPG